MDIALTVATVLHATHRYHKAIDFYKEALVLLSESEQENLYTRKMKSCLLYCSLASALRNIEHYDEALEKYKEALRIYQEIGIRVMEVEKLAYRGISNVYFFLCRYAHVIFYERKLIEIAKETGDKQTELSACTTIGNAYHFLGKQDKSIECLNEALRKSREVGDREGECTALYFLGSIHSELSQYDKAISLLERCIQIHREVGDHRGEAKLYLKLGHTYLKCGALDKGLACHYKSLEMTTELGDLLDLGVCYNGIGNSYLSMGRNCEALDCFEKALEIMSKYGYKSLEGRAHHSLGLCHSHLGQYKKSLDHYEKSRAILRNTGDRYIEGKSCAGLAFLYSEIGKYEKSFKFYKEALEIAKESGNRRLESHASCGLGGVCFRLNPQSSEGETLVRNAITISKDIGDEQKLALGYITLAEICSYKGQYKESLKNYECGIKITKKTRDMYVEATASICLASVYDGLGMFAKVTEQTRIALHIIGKIGDKGMEHIALSSLGVYNLKGGEFKKAREYLFESITSIERNRERLQDEYKLSLDNQTCDNYTVLFIILLIQGNIVEALCTAERGRARALADLMSTNYGVRLKRQHSDGIHVAAISNLSTQNHHTIIFMAVAMEEVFFWTIAEKGKISFKLSKWESHEESITNLLKLPREQLLRTWDGGHKDQCEDRSLSAYYKVQSSPVEKEGEVTGQRLVKEEDELREGKTETQESILHLLYRRLFAPVVDHFQKQDIIIVPEGDMWMVPFPALKDANGKFVSETYSIRLVPSLTALNMIQASPDDFHKQTGALIVGDPDVHPTTNLSPLPEARKEAQEIAELLGVTATVGRQATKKEVLRGIQEVSLIHVAAHGDTERGEIALAVNRHRPSCQVPRKEDFMLTMEDVAKVGVRAKLVVLSCCHSGRGEIMKSEGVVGIARAFLASGARSVLVSLWALDDKSTKEFMLRFYGHLVRDKLSASQAVHQSIKWMRESAEYSGVGHWAPFVLIGDDVKLNL